MANTIQISAAEYEALKAKAAKADRPSKLTFKVSTKGALSIYGMGRFPITLYKEQWQRILGLSAELNEFIKANDELLKEKGE